ncbi:MAG: TolC family protein [Nitrospiria bacterium]
MKRHVLHVLIWIFVLFALFDGHFSNAAAQTVITLEEAYRSAIIKSESLAIAREALVQSENEIKRKKSFLYPNIKTSLDYQRRPRARTSGTFLLRSKSETDFSLTLSQPLYSGGRAQSAYQDARLAQKGELLQFSLTKEDLLFEIAKTYYETLKAQNNVKIEAKEVERLTAHRRSAQKQLEVGEVTRTALLRAEAELSDAQAELIRAKNEVLASKDQLALLARIDGDFTLQDPKPVSLADHPETEWLALADEHRIELKREDIRISQADEGITFARGNFLPSLSLDLQYRFSDQDPATTFLIKDDRMAILKLEMPLFEGMLRTSELAQARSRLRQSRLEKKRLRDEIATQVRLARLALSSLTSELKHLKDQVRFAKEAFSLASRQFEVGLGTSIEVLDANTALLDAERRYSNTVYDREIAILQVKKEAGLFTAMTVSETD